MTNYFDDDSFWDDQASEATGQIARVNRRTPERTRSHHVVERDATPPPMQHADDEDVLWLEPVSRRSERLGSFGNIDPRLLSVGAIAVAAILAVPLIGALGDDGGDDTFRSIAEAQASTSTAVPTTAPVEIVITAAVDPVELDSAESDSSTSEIEPASELSSESDAPSDVAEETESASAGDSAPTALRAPDGCSNTYEVVAGDYWVGIADTAGVPLDDLLAANGASAETALFPGSAMCLPEGASIASAGEGGSTGGEVAMAAQPDACTNMYATAQGDYWLRIAEASGVSLDELLATNNATAETPIYPGTEICLPAGATTPTPATEAPTTPAPTTAAPTTAAPTTTVPATTRPTTTQPRNTTPPPSGGEVEQMIRDVWPDELEADALRIAWRESNYRPDVTSSTGCCVGVFQIHWEAHRSWLDGIGVTSRDQLFDARANIQAAYALYQRNGGWGPWSQTY